MADMIADGASWLVSQLQGSLSQTVTLSRGGDDTTGVLATKGQPRGESDPSVNEDILHCDWIISVSEYVIDGAASEPQKNDTITESDGKVWTVLPLTSEQEARPFDPFGNGWRVHTKQTAE